jgi:hypothetical protein
MRANKGGHLAASVQRHAIKGSLKAVKEGDPKK